MKTDWVWRGIIALVLVALGVNALLFARAPGGHGSLRTGREAPAFSGRLTGGERAQLADYRGKVVLVDFWATWCPKCREDFPHTVALERKYGPQGLVVVSLACDDDDKTDEIMSFLREQEATIHNLRGVHGTDEQTFEEFQIEGGALPHYKLYDRKGELRKTFAIDPDKDTQFSLADIDAAVEELVAEDKKPAEAEKAVDTAEPDGK